MNKRLIGGTILFLGLILAATFVYDYYIDDQKNNKDPRYLSSYIDSGYYTINPETILTSLDRGETDVFTPLLEDPGLVEALTNVNFSWTQADFLQIANALSQLVWKEPINLKDWNVYQITFTSHCRSKGFDYGEITYFKEDEKNLRKVYVTRHIEIDPYFGTVRWGGGETYPQPIWNRWNGIDLADTKITADDALEIAEENGGQEARAREGNACRMYLRMPINQRDNYDKWDISILGDYSFEMLVDPYTGEYEIPNNNK